MKTILYMYTKWKKISKYKTKKCIPLKTQIQTEGIYQDEHTTSAKLS